MPNNTLLNDQWVIEEIREEKNSRRNLMKMKTQPFRTLGCSKGKSEGKS
jgi:hypothetical protein